MQSTGVTINDGDDEDDNVTNTGANYSRIDMLALMRGILATAASGSQIYSPALAEGSNTVTGLNFGNQLTSSPKLAATASGTSTMPGAAEGKDTFSITTATFADLSQTGTSDRPQATARAIPAEMLVGQQPLSRLVDTMFAANTPAPLATEPIQSDAAVNSSGPQVQVIDSLFAVVEGTWDAESVDRLLEQQPDPVEDAEAALWPADEAFDEWLG